MNDITPPYPHPQVWRISTSWTLLNSGPQQAKSRPEPYSPSPLWREAKDIREEFREERNSEMSALIEDYRDAGKAASDFVQSLIKSGFILNGGGIVAIPAIVTLFNLEIEGIPYRTYWPFQDRSELEAERHKARSRLNDIEGCLIATPAAQFRSPAQSP